jgi:hypothetical protein
LFEPFSYIVGKKLATGGISYIDISIGIRKREKKEREIGDLLTSPEAYQILDRNYINSLNISCHSRSIAGNKAYWQPSSHNYKVIKYVRLLK